MFRLISLLSACLVTVLARNETPIIGILSQETYSVQKYFPNETYKSYIAASYVKYLESAGARVVPIWIGREESYYRQIVEDTNGIFWPGGATWFNETGGYADAGELLYKYALEKNKNGDYYPLWGSCLGMELLAEIAMGSKEIRQDCSAKKIALPLNFKQGYETSKLFVEAPKDVLEILKTENVTYNYHQFCITEAMFGEYNLLQDWQIITTNKDINNFEFISTFESKHYPFYGIQFHPEKNQFEYKVGQNIPHSKDAVYIAQYFSNFFVEECRKNNHSYSDWNSEQKALIYNYKPHFTGILNSAYEQLYMFNATENLS